MTEQAMIERLTQIIHELARLEPHLPEAPLPGLCAAARLQLGLLQERLIVLRRAQA
jgi:hypothetical protein